MHYPQFSTKQLLTTIACISLALGIIVFCYRMPALIGGEDFDDHTYGVLYCVLASPAAGAVGGLGVGLLLDQRIAGSLLGMLVAFAITAIALATV